jgi:hypothetical protein
MNRTIKIAASLNKRLVSLPILAFAFTSMVISQAPSAQIQHVPTVALIGEHESAFAELAVENPGILLSVCGNDMDIAYEKWTDMLVAMEDYAESTGFDINGLKTYFYIFWNADGSFRHLAFYPKANSRNIANEDIQAFLTAFTGEYRMTIKAKEGYSHYGSASFPTHARPELKAKRD